MSKIFVDAFGGDNAPLAVIDGCRQAVDEFGADITLCGDKAKIEKCASENKISLDGFSFLDVPDVIDMHDDPALVVKAKKESSSMGAGLVAVAAGEGDAFVSAGSTGALLMGATFIVKRKKGVKRGALASIMPAKKGPLVIVDCGANADCRPEMLLQFGYLGEEYAMNVLGIKNPRIGLLNIGAEETKGDELRLATYALLEESDMNFVGNIEARNIPYSKCDVLVCDGFSGNVALKLIEGTSMYLVGLLKEGLMSSFKTKIGAILAKDAFKSLKKKMDYAEYGGAPILGVTKPVIKAHGSSNAKAFKNAVKQAMKFADTNE
ncbi:MAG: phosphate acyltransferase PlsX [Clostridia bacterium]|nr:phosphate acyltransferase PlsX [Clostridia bacterium]